MLTNVPLRPDTLRPPLVQGFRRDMVAMLVWCRVTWLALRMYRDPLQLLKALSRIRAARATAPSLNHSKMAFSSGRYFWDLYAPGWPSAAFDRYIEREFDRVLPRFGRPPALQTAIIAMTRRCPMRCEHCCEWDALNRREALSTQDLQEIVHSLQQRGISQLFLSGGEPMQRFDDLLALAAMVSAETDVWVLSSGRGFTADRAGRLHGAGVTGVALSLDHWDPSEHDHFRGTPGSFEAVQRAAVHAHRAGLLVTLSLCPTRSFAAREHLDRYAQTARSLGASFIQILEPKPVGHYAGQDVGLWRWQQVELERFTTTLNGGRAARDLPAVAYPDWYVRTYTCLGAGDRYVYIDTNGSLHACPFCRSRGISVLDCGIDEAIARLQATGCPAAVGADMARNQL